MKFKSVIPVFKSSKPAFLGVILKFSGGDYLALFFLIIPILEPTPQSQIGPHNLTKDRENRKMPSVSNGRDKMSASDTNRYCRLHTVHMSTEHLHLMWLQKKVAGS